VQLPWCDLLYLFEPVMLSLDLYLNCFTCINQALDVKLEILNGNSLPLETGFELDLS
jgi:hypothetical protein